MAGDADRANPLFADNSFQTQFDFADRLRTRYDDASERLAQMRQQFVTAEAKVKRASEAVDSTHDRLTAAQAFEAPTKAQQTAAATAQNAYDTAVSHSKHCVETCRDIGRDLDTQQAQIDEIMHSRAKLSAAIETMKLNAIQLDMITRNDPANLFAAQKKALDDPWSSNKQIFIDYKYASKAAGEHNWSETCAPLPAIQLLFQAVNCSHRDLVLQHSCYYDYTHGMSIPKGDLGFQRPSIIVEHLSLWIDEYKRRFPDDWELLNVPAGPRDAFPQEVLPYKGTVIRSRWSLALKARF